MAPEEGAWVKQGRIDECAEAWGTQVWIWIELLLKATIELDIRIAIH